MLCCIDGCKRKVHRKLTLCSKCDKRLYEEYINKPSEWYKMFGPKFLEHLAENNLMIDPNGPLSHLPDVRLETSRPVVSNGEPDPHREACREGERAQGESEGDAH